MKISDNVDNMDNKERNKLDEAVKLKLKDEFIYGYVDENGVRQFPTISALSKRHDVPNVTLHRWSKKEDWQSQKNRVHTEYEEAVKRERLEKMVQDGSRLDDNAIALALAMMSDAGRRIQEDRQNRSELAAILDMPKGNERDVALEKFKTKHKILTTHDMNSIASTVASAQKIGKLALGQAQEISKVSANVSAPDSLREVIEQLDELAAAKSSGAKHIIQ